MKQPYFPFSGCFEDQQVCRFILYRCSRSYILITL